VPVDFVVTPDRVIDCRARRAPRPETGIVWDDLTRYDLRCRIAGWLTDLRP
jgi:hypothetical protein